MVSSLRHLNGTAADNVLSRDIRDRPLTAGPRSCDEQWIDRNRHRTRIRVSAIGTPGSFMPAERVTASHPTEPLPPRPGSGGFGAIAPDAMARPDRPLWVEPCRSISVPRTAGIRRPPAARREAETFLERPVFGIKRPFSNALRFRARANIDTASPPHK